MLPVRLSGVCYEAGGRRLLDRIDLTIGPCGRSVLLGPNGAGKTLLLRILRGLIAPSSGRVSWSRAPGSLERGDLAMVFQRPVLLRRSTAANIRYALAVRGVSRSRRRAICRDVLERTGLAHRARQPARTLSGGEQQRLAIARAWAGGPQILLLDEPTANLDPAGVRSVEDLIREVVKTGTHVVLATHDLGQAHRLAREVVFLHRGRCLEHAPADRFFEKPESPEAQAFLAGELFA